MIRTFYFPMGISRQHRSVTRYRQEYRVLVDGDSASRRSAELQARFAPEKLIKPVLALD